MATEKELLAQIEALKAELAKRPEAGKLRLKVSPKGGLSVYGLGRFPVTLYKSQWLRLIGFIEEIKAFIKANDKLLKEKGEEEPPVAATGTEG